MAKRNYYDILGVRVPHIEFYVRPGRDIARLVEVAALVQALKNMGHDPAKTFNDRLIAHMAEQPLPRAISHHLKSATTAPFELYSTTGWPMTSLNCCGRHVRARTW